MAKMWVLDELLSKKDDFTNIAIEHRSNKKTYGELWKESDTLASWIIKNDDTKAPIIIYGNKNIEIVVVMLAALKSGRAYVPVDVTFPIERLGKIVSITEAHFVFDFTNSSDVKENIDNSVVVKKSMYEDIIKSLCFEEISCDNWVGLNDICYILFTSGSTGDPKGVQISKANILNFVEWFLPYADVNGDVVLNQVSYSFDVSVIQIYLYMPMGKRLFCIDKEMVTDYDVLFKVLSESNISTWVSTPSFIEMCSVYDGFNRDLLPKIEKIILAGEVLSKRLVASLWEKLGNVKVINGYGPTEATVLLTCCLITEDMISDSDNELPIGYMIDDAEYYFEDGKEVYENADGNTGELVVSTNSLSAGYYKQPDLTNKSFINKRIGNEVRRYYRTGDITYKKDALLYYVGRKDFQIKLNGYRIELGDISSNINSIYGVTSSVVVPIYEGARVSYIAAFIMVDKETMDEKSKSTFRIRKELSKTVPSYMIPKKIVLVDHFPLNTNGKIDQKMLVKEYIG